MKTRYSALFFLAVGLSLAGAQEPELAPGSEGYVEIVNTISLKSPTQLAFGREASPAYFEVTPGMKTGTMPLYSGDYKILVKNEQCIKPEISEKLTLTAGTYHTVILYTDLEERNGEMVPRLRVSAITGERKTGEPKLSIISLSTKPVVNVTVGGQGVALTPKRVQNFDVKMNDAVSIKQGGEMIVNVEFTTPVTHIVFLYDQPGTDLMDHTLIRQTIVLPATFD